VEELRTSYQADHEWWLEIARTGYPDQPRLWDKHRTADVAYGIRYRQLVGRVRERRSSQTGPLRVPLSLICAAVL
jgi:hypothetical protein